MLDGPDDWQLIDKACRLRFHDRKLGARSRRIAAEENVSTDGKALFWRMKDRSYEGSGLFGGGTLGRFVVGCEWKSLAFRMKFVRGTPV